MGDLTGLIAVVGGILLILVPIAGLTARFALKPLIDSISKAMQARQGAGVDTLLGMERRLAALEAEVTSMRGELQNASDAKSFDRQLAASSSNPGDAS